jgi:hypothetical protein
MIKTKLVAPNVPADQGLSSLGLLMQLGGSVFAGLNALFLLTLLPMASVGSEMSMFILLFAAGVARSLLHRRAGTDLLYRRRSNFDGEVSPLAGIKRYIIAAGIHTALVALLLKTKFHATGKDTLAMAAGFAVWPAVLAVLIQLPRFKRYETQMPVSEDKGFEGAAIIMTVLGTCGVIANGLILYFMLDNADRLLDRAVGLLLIGATVMLFIRSIFHVQAGIAGLRDLSVDRFVERTNRYANFGIIASFCAAGAFLLAVMMDRPDPSMLAVVLAVVCGFAWLLLAWPLIIRRFCSERRFGDLIAGNGASVHRRAPDAGLTSLGWLLLGTAAMSATALLPELIGTSDGGATRALVYYNVSSASIWWDVGLVALQAWAGYELIRMSGPSRTIASAYAVLSLLVTLILKPDMIKALTHGFDLKLNPAAITVIYGFVAIALVMPIVTLVLVNRKIMPMARARYKPHGAPQG